MVNELLTPINGHVFRNSETIMLKMLSRQEKSLPG